MKKIPYTFNIRMGHYVYTGVLNEDENTEKETATSEKESEAEPVYLESDEVVQLKQDMQAKLNTINNEINTKKSLVTAAENKLNQARANKTVTQDQIKILQKQVLQAKYDTIEKEFQYKKEKYEFDKKIILAQEKLLEVKHHDIPEKYKGLNESNIHNAKVYLDTLVGNNVEGSILKDMHDFKHAFKESELLYGKDKNGYFAVCIDKQDFEKIANTLEEVGYLRSEIIDAIMPQILDRSDMVK